jgi:SpoVT / AbrB like domain.
MKGAHKKVGGTVTKTLASDRITIRTENGSEKPFQVREMLQQKIAGLQKGDTVILLVDNDNKVIDVAIPPPTR